MPYSLVLHCFPKNGALSAEDLQGQKALALFLQELIQRQDEVLAARLHEPRRVKPFTTAILKPAGSRGLRGSGGSSGSDLEGIEIRVRITLLDDALYPLVSQFFLRDVGDVPTLQLGRASLLISKLTVTPESEEPWSGFSSFEDIVAQASEAETAWTIRFWTPTCFKVGDAEVPLPYPRLVFQSWLNSWEQHAPKPLFADKGERKAFLGEVVEGHVTVSFDRLVAEEKAFYFDGRRTRERGFTGICRFVANAKKLEPIHLKILATLAAYSFYSGTGRKTTMGMGVTRRIR